MADLKPWPPNRVTGAASFGDRLPERLHEQTLAHQALEAERRLAVAVIEKRRGIASKLEHAQTLVDHDGRRPEASQQQAIRLAWHFRSRRFAGGARVAGRPRRAGLALPRTASSRAGPLTVLRE